MAFSVNPKDIPPQYLDETSELRFELPTVQEKLDSAALEETLVKMDIFESYQEAHQRHLALSRLQKISNVWIYKKALEQKIPNHNARCTQGKVFTFGSYRLGVNFKGADIDALLVVPRFITREDFFNDFQTVLSEEDCVEDLRAVPDAFVPVLKMKLLGVEIDLLFAQVDLMTVRDDFSLSENTEQLLRNMDEQDVRSVSGVRVTNYMLNFVYSKDIFQKSLKVIRLWAKRRNIYSNAVGFLGGVSWAILTFYICQFYPRACPSSIVYTFFRIYSEWPWPKPVRLCESEHIPSLNLPVWDPRRNPTDRFHLMPILTPSYPSQNSAYNVQRSNRIIIEREIKQGYATVEDIVHKKRPWSDLFTPSFFFSYQHYLVVVVTGYERRRFMERCGLVESRLRVLVNHLENNRYVKLAHVNCRSFGKGPQDDDVEFVKKWFVGIEFDQSFNSATSINNHTIATRSNEPPIFTPKVNVDLLDVIRKFEIALERGNSSNNFGVYVTVKYLEKQHLGQYLPPEEMAIVRKHGLARCATNQQSSASASDDQPGEWNGIQIGSRRLNSTNDVFTSESSDDEPYQSGQENKHIVDNSCSLL